MPDTFAIEGLTKSFGNITAVNNLTLSGHQGEIIALLGPNGAGKSTLMNMLAGYLAPDCGKIHILGMNLRDHPLACKAATGFLPEGSPLYPDLSARTYLRYLAELRNLPAARIDEVASLAKIENILSQKIETLSKGYLRRVGFAQSLLADPPLLLLDEPTDGLDPNQKRHMQNLITRMGRTKTILISTHLLDEAEAVADRILVMDHGQILADGNLQTLLQHYQANSLSEIFTRLTGGSDA